MVDFVCPFCDWEGTDPVTDAHMNAFCPKCGRPVQFKAFYKKPPSGSP
ncbi:MAG: zinc ribbon domain-containing protein [Thermoplasmata archaeon]